MKILYRLGFYLGGFAIGLILLAFFLKGSGSSIPSCDYFPGDRVLKSIRTKGYVLSEEAEAQLYLINIDTTQLSTLFREGEVIFSKSEQRKKPCGLFYIKSGESLKTPIAVIVENCEEEATIKTIEKI